MQIPLFTKRTVTIIVCFTLSLIEAISTNSNQIFYRIYARVYTYFAIYKSFDIAANILYTILFIVNRNTDRSPVAEEKFAQRFWRSLTRRRIYCRSDGQRFWYLSPTAPAGYIGSRRSCGVSHLARPTARVRRPTARWRHTRPDIRYAREHCVPCYLLSDWRNSRGSDEWHARD